MPTEAWFAWILVFIGSFAYGAIASFMWACAIEQIVDSPQSALDALTKVVWTATFPNILTSVGWSLTQWWLFLFSNGVYVVTLVVALWVVWSYRSMVTNRIRPLAKADDLVKVLERRVVTIRIEIPKEDE